MPATGTVDILTLLSRDTDLRRVASTSGGEYAGPCPWCGGRDRFRAWPESGRWWCRQCGRRGDSIQYLRDCHGLTFTEAKRALGLDTSIPPHTEIVRRKAHKAALEAARDAYETWDHWKFQELADEYINLLIELDIAESAYRAMRSHPEWFSNSERAWWEEELSRVYDRLPVVEHNLNILTFRDCERERFLWWQEAEAERG